MVKIKRNILNVQFMKLKITLKDLQESGDESEREPRCYHKDNAGKKLIFVAGSGDKKIIFRY